MHGVHKYIVPQWSDNVSIISLPFWENEKLDPVKKLKINGEDIRCSPLMRFIFERLSLVDRLLAEEVILRGKLIWEYMKWRKTFDDSGIREYHVPCGTEKGYFTLWELLEDDLTAPIRADGISVGFNIYHFNEFPDLPCIRVILSGRRVRDNGMIFIG